MQELLAVSFAPRQHRVDKITKDHFLHARLCVHTVLHVTEKGTNFLLRNSIAPTKLQTGTTLANSQDPTAHSPYLLPLLKYHFTSVLASIQDTSMHHTLAQACLPNLSNCASNCAVTLWAIHCYIHVQRFVCVSHSTQHVTK